MAKKDTIKALMNRGASEEVATQITNSFSTLKEIKEAGVSALVEIGIEESVAADVVASLGNVSSSKGTSKTKATKVADESESVAEPSSVPEEPMEEYNLKKHVYTETELKFIDIREKLGVFLPDKIIFDIASKYDKLKDKDPAKAEEVFTDDVCVKLITRAAEMCKAHAMCKNESAGVMAAHSIGEPGTQLNLRTFHSAGDASITVTMGLPRLIEIVDARREPSTPTMTIPLTGLAAEDKSLAEHVAHNIQSLRLIDVAKIEIDVVNMCLTVIPDWSHMRKLGLELDDLVKALDKIRAVQGLVEKAADFGAQGSAMTNLIITERPGEEAPFAKLQSMYDAIKNARIKGIDKIKRALVEPDPDKPGTFHIVTEGSNLREVLKVDFVDKDNVMTNSILEIEEVFGIEAARNSIIHEAVSTLEPAGMDVDVRHIMLVADLMTNDGTVKAIGRNGISGKKSSVLARAAFEITAAHLLHAAMVGESDRLEGVTENIIVGQPVTLGTGAVKLIYDPKKN